MRKKRKYTSVCLIMAMLIGLLSPLCTKEIYQAASSYENAKEFYESTAKKDKTYHAEAYNGKVYYGTQAKLAASSTNTRYCSVGWDVTLSGNGYSVSFTVQKEGGSMEEIDSYKDDTYEYNLYYMTETTLYDLMDAVDADSAAYVRSASTINVCMNAIMTTIEGGEVKGSITEDGSGGFTSTGTIYRLKDEADLKKMKDIFSGHEFKSFKEVYVDLDNFLLKVHYAVNGTPYINASSTTKAAVSGDYRLVNYSKDGVVTPYVLYNSSGSMFTNSARTLEELTLLNPASVGLTKEGYHLNAGSEWVTGGSVPYSADGTYKTMTLEPNVGIADSDLTLYANWKPNTYSVHYDSNGGLGKILPSTHVYDQPGKLREGSFIREGYTLLPGAEWNTEPDGTGTSYGSKDNVYNLTAENGGKITLYANWKKAVYGVETNKDGGSGGTDVFYEQYKEDWFSDAELNNTTDSIYTPQKMGYWFSGYYTYYLGMGDKIIDKDGNIVETPDYFSRNSKIYAKWEPKQYSILFNKMGGSGGWDSVTATYDKMVPFAGNSPTMDGYSFGGYYDGKNGSGKRYYNEHMSGEEYFRTDGNLTLFAHWLDETPPIVTLQAPIEWSNESGGIKITATATDIGTGLSRVELWRGDTLLQKYGWTEKLTSYTIEYHNKIEGVHQYRLIAYDKSGNSAECYITVRYDATAPSLVGEYTITNNDYGNFGITFTATDYKIP